MNDAERLTEEQIEHLMKIYSFRSKAFSAVPEDSMIVSVLTEVRELRNAVHAFLDLHEYTYDGPTMICRFCGAALKTEAHRGNCAWVQALNAVVGEEKK